MASVEFGAKIVTVLVTGNATQFSMVWGPIKSSLVPKRISLEPM